MCSPWPYPCPCSCIGGGAASAVCDCELATTVVNRTAIAAIKKRERIDFIDFSWGPAKGPVELRTIIGTRFRDGAGKESVNRGKVLSTGILLLTRLCLTVLFDNSLRPAVMACCTIKC